MDLRRLRHAIAIMEKGNFVKAAESLHLSQPALSQSIAALEVELGFRVFDRNRSGVLLTGAGKIFIERAKEILLHAKNIEHDMALVKDGRAGRVSFGLGPIPAACILKSLLIDVLTTQGNLDLNIEMGFGAHFMDHLLAEQIEFFVASKNYSNTDFNTLVRPIGTLSMSLFSRAKHPLTKKDALKLKDICDYPLLTPRHQSEALPVLKFRESDQGVKHDFRSIIYCDDLQLLIELASTTNSILYLPRAAVKDKCNSGQLIQMKLTDIPQLKVDLVIVSIAGRTLSPPAEKVVQKILALFENTVNH